MGADPVTAAVVSAVVGLGASLYGSHKERKQAKKELRLQRAELARQKQEELAERKSMIDQQREQLIATGVGTRGYSSSGIKANILG